MHTLNAEQYRGLLDNINNAEFDHMAQNIAYIIDNNHSSSRDLDVRSAVIACCGVLNIELHRTTNKQMCDRVQRFLDEAESMEKNVRPPSELG